MAYKMKGFSGFKNSPVKKINWGGFGKKIGEAADTDAGQGIIGHLGKTLIDKLFNFKKKALDNGI